jgi:uroporphyrinogen decarboxylase
MDKRERLEKTIAGVQADRLPVSLWRYWPGDDQRAADLAHAIIQFQKMYDWDFVTVLPANTFLVTDYGLQDQWDGSICGTRQPTKYLINRSLEWTELRALDPTRGTLGRHLECLRLIEDGLADEDTPIIHAIPNPLAQAAYLSGRETVIRHMRTHPDRLHTGLNILTETTLRLLETIRRTSIAGILLMVHHASYEVMSAEEYQTFGLPYDRKILEALPSGWWLNSTHLGGQVPMFRFADTYPVQVINWQDQDTDMDLAKGKSLITGAVCGGLSSTHHIQHGTPASIREAARTAITQTNGRRFILSAGSPICVTSPLSNIRAVREAVNQAGVG